MSPAEHRRHAKLCQVMYIGVVVANRSYAPTPNNFFESVAYLLQEHRRKRQTEELQLFDGRGQDEGVSL